MVIAQESMVRSGSGGEEEYRWARKPGDLIAPVAIRDDVGQFDAPHSASCRASLSHTQSQVRHRRRPPDAVNSNTTPVNVLPDGGGATVLADGCGGVVSDGVGAVGGAITVRSAPVSQAAMPTMSAVAAARRHAACVCRNIFATPPVRAAIIDSCEPPQPIFKSIGVIATNRPTRC